MGRRFASVVLLVLLIATPIVAQTLYKFRGEDGEWIYSDRRPQEGQEVEVRQLQSTFVQPAFSIRHNVVNSTVEFIAYNEFFAPVEVRIAFEDIQGVEYPHPDEGLRWVVGPRSEVLLLDLAFIADYSSPHIDFGYEYTLGDPTARHLADEGYRVPYSAGLGFPISQAYPDAITHQTVDSIYAVDVVMPVGTDVLAARGGIVVDVSADNYRGGLDFTRDGQAANIVRILHDDGTFSLYAHLNWNSIRVKPGDTVRPGQYIADSGNTGFSSGPHLHFAVQKNVGLRVQSLPISFQGINSSLVAPTTGDTLTAY